jgi:hypothetical protein
MNPRFLLCANYRANAALMAKAWSLRLFDGVWRHFQGETTQAAIPQQCQASKGE